MTTAQDTTHATDASGPRRAEPGGFSARAGLGPMIFESWYVIAASADVGHELSSITVLNQKLAFYRAEDGTPVVMDDRCPHRRYSLSKSHLKGDTVQCGYHGFTFDRTGACVFAPGVEGELNFGVRIYPAVERGLWLWVWMGEGEADPAEIPLPEIAEQTPHGIHVYTLNGCNYQLLHENLLDLTHLHYLHGPHVAAAEYANTPPTVIELEGKPSVGFTKDVPTTAFAVPGLFCGADGSKLVRQTETGYTVGPALHYGLIRFFDLDGTPTVPHRQVVLHAITPETDGSTHQFTTIRFDAPLARPAEELVAVVKGIFDQDVDALAMQSENIASDDRAGVVENSIPSDIPGLRLRRILARMAAAEQQK